MLKIAIIGRANVGKSTLFNRLTGKNHAIVDDQPGVTRDNRYALAYLAGLEFEIIDTAGLDDTRKDLQKLMTDKALSAADEADAILFVVDGVAGLSEQDQDFARTIRRKNKQVILCVNKAESKKASENLGEFYKLGFEPLVFISAEHGQGMGELFEALEPLTHNFEDTDLQKAQKPPPVMQIAIIGRPNAGKSTLINEIIGQERLLTGDMPGLTRDAIAVEAEYQGQKLKLVDTAGMRRKSNVKEKIEKLAVKDSLRAIQYAHVVVLMLDATKGLEKQDKTLARLVADEGRAMIVALNKSDLVQNRAALVDDIEHMINNDVSELKTSRLVFISAKTGDKIDTLLDTCFEIYKTWNQRIPTARLNEFIRELTMRHSPPLVKGRRLKIKYITQSKSRPPTFSIFTNFVKQFPKSYLRYIKTEIRKNFGLEGVPLKINIKKSENPYADIKE